MQHLLDVAKKFDLPLVASNDVHYLDKLDWTIHDVLIQMRDQRDSRTDKKVEERKKLTVVISFT